MAASLTALVNRRVMGEHGLREGLAVLIDGARIAAVCPADDPRVSQATTHDLGGKLLLPGFIDVQVNGGGGLLFNDDPTVETLRGIAAAHRTFGTTGLLPTLITDTRETMRRALEAVDAAIEQGVPGILGIHLEGPFLAGARKGIHDSTLFRPLDEEDLALITAPRTDDAPDAELVAARREALEKEAALEAAKRRVEGLDRAIDVFERDQAATQELYDAAVKQLEAAKTAETAIIAQMKERSEAGATADEMARLEARRLEAEASLEAARRDVEAGNLPAEVADDRDDGHRLEVTDAERKARIVLHERERLALVRQRFLVDRVVRPTPLELRHVVDDRERDRDRRALGLREARGVDGQRLAVVGRCDRRTRARGGDRAGAGQRHATCESRRGAASPVRLAAILAMLVATAAPGRAAGDAITRFTDIAPALLACWRPPAGTEGMEITVVFGFRRDGALLGPPRISHARLTGDLDLRKRFVASALAAVADCTPLRFAPSLGGAVAGRPFAMLFRALSRGARA